MASRSLGTLTLDLIAKVGGFVAGMDAAERRSAKWRAQVEKDMKAAGKTIGIALGAGATAAATALVLVVNKQRDLIDQQAKAAQMLDTTYTSLANLGRAGELGGVGMEKIEAASRQLNLNIGRAIGGTKAQAEAFERLGLSAQDVYELPLDQRIATINQALRDNVQASERASVAADIYGAKNAKAIQQLDPGTIAEAARQVELFGLNLSDVDAAKVEMANDALSTFGQLGDGIGKQLTVELAPILMAIGDEFLRSAEQAGGIGSAVENSVDKAIAALAFVMDAADGVKRSFLIITDIIIGALVTAQFHVQGLVAAMIDGLNLIPGIEIDTSGLRESADLARNIAAEAAANIQDTLNRPMAGAAFKQFVADARAAGEAAAEATIAGRELVAQSGQQEAGKEAEAAAKKLQSAYETVEQSYQRQIALINTEVDKRKDATEVAKLQFEIESGKLVGINAEQQKRLNSLAEELDRLKQLKQANEDAAKAQAFRATLNESNATARAGFAIELAGSGSGDKLRERLRADLEIQQDYNKQLADLQKQLNSGDIGQSLYDKETDLLRQALAERLEIQHEYYAAQDEAQSNWLDGVTSAWENYRDTATDYQQQAADFTTQTLDGLTSAVGDGIASMIMDGESLADVFKNIAQTMATSIINALAQMAAQWLVYQAVQLVTGKAAQASAASTLVANAQATAFQAQLAAFASTAAIPIVGPVLAPAAAASAAIATAPMVAGVAASALAGMAHDGIDAVPETGTWLLQKGERVTTAETSAKLDRTLDDVRSNQSSGGAPTINLIEDRSRAGQVNTRRQDDQYIIDVVVADLFGDGRTSKAIGSSFGIRRSGT
ncbi:phage tail tape measure protein [Pseudomonas aeruginosa]|uniref:phage tail tape measure protein n=1 Tax=Pseudomonas aeruginosa TaxID=287 RepID=UPI00163CFD95|nr:phage tail tape measure protein [Pseudomonas aeruginosa]EIY2609548.1 phage tail tape measure protein [Pseudomonas aeruginosa]EIY2741547.1 phage tail tape measure protein [Pseudomonas aeruginosa]EKM0200648.1 phage tail tape measure protein [Pseudomonas aeruginosa]EKM0220178.1 phage tail tape measure protein [Pseudomonas aeruginosa]EKU2851168.1 phage tail tape measure protein [Pseudomonas aeruginosa]